MKKSMLWLCLAFALLFHSAWAESPGSRQGVFLSGGSGQDDIDIFRLAWRYRPGGALFCLAGHCFDGYYETSLGYWNGNRNDIGVVAFSPVLMHEFKHVGKRFHPYVEAGIGAALLSHTRIDDRNLSSGFVFEDRIGVGLRSRHLDVGFLLMHYSNAELKEPNNGLSMAMVTIGYWF